MEDVRVGPDGIIWVAYFDEGIYGADPTSAPGLVGFETNGHRSFEFDHKQAGTDPIDDLYALNVTSEGVVWAYFYSQFPIVRLVGRMPRVWTCGVEGARALAVRGDRALLLGAYGDPSKGHLLSLGNGTDARLLEVVTVRAPDGTSLENANAHAVGEKIYFTGDRHVSVLDDW